MTQPTHYLYLDDSGTKEYGPHPESYGVDQGSRGNSRYFVFGGLLIPQSASSILAQRISDLKFQHFGSRTVEIKSNWLRIPSMQGRKYLEPYNLKIDDLIKFIDEYYAV